jgi:heme/copper-type cytochrome/quinol oxidase subunit 1
MHPLGHPRNAIVVGVVFVVLAIIYWTLPYLSAPNLVDDAGTVMLAALGLAMGLMAYVLIAGSPRG